MLENSQSNPKAHTSFNWTFEKAFVMILIGTLIGAFLGSMLWLLLPGPRANRSELWTILGFGAAFGGWVSFFSCVSFSLIHRIRENVRRSALRMMLTFAILSGIAGAPVFFFFGDGLAMAVGLAIEAAVFGGLIGGILGICLFFVMFQRRASEMTR